MFAMLIYYGLTILHHNSRNPLRHYIIEKHFSYYNLLIRHPDSLSYS